MPRPLVLLIYNLLLPFALLAMMPSALRKMKQRGGTWRDLWQRLGFFSAQQKENIRALRERGPLIWMHAVSVGEVGIARKLIEEMLRQRAGLGFVLSTTTPTGHALAQEFAASAGIVVIYNPLDGWASVRRCLSLIRPAQIVLVEAELWPNLLHAAHGRSIPVSLVNARLSPRSERRYAKFRAFVQPVFSLLQRVFVQEPEDPARWAALGVPRGRITHSGSIKFDVRGQPEPKDKVARFRTLLASVGCDAERPVILAASTHDGEEAELARVFQNLRVTHPRLFLIIVPRHVERAEKVESDLRAAGLQVIRRSMMDRAAPPADATDCLLVDTTGELRAWQYCATIVVIGKSFLAVGGQNPAEALMAGRPVIFGPHMENFDALVRMLLAKHGALQVPDFPALTERMDGMLQDLPAALAMARDGHEALRAHEGATARTAEALLA